MEISIALHHSYVLNCCPVFDLPSPFVCPLSSDLSCLARQSACPILCVALSFDLSDFDSVCPLVCLISTVSVLWSV